MKLWKLKDEHWSTQVVPAGSPTYDKYVAAETNPDTDKYEDISSISNWKTIGPTLSLRHTDIRSYIEAIFAATGSPGYDWDLLTTQEKKYVAECFLVDKTKRDEVLTQQEQDAYNHFYIYHFLSDDAYHRYGGVDLFLVPKSIDYKKDLDQRLHPKYTFDQYGFLVEVEYFANLSVSLDGYGFPVYNYSNPVLKYQASYQRDDAGYVTTRTVTRSWTRMDGTYDPDVKTSFKIYDKKQSREEGNRRRRNLINNLLIETVGLILITSNDLTTVTEAEADAMPFLAEVEQGISLYYESGAKEDALGNPCKLVQDVTNSTYARLDNVISASPYMTIRDYILAGLDPA